MDFISLPLSLSPSLPPSLPSLSYSLVPGVVSWRRYRRPSTGERDRSIVRFVIKLLAYVQDNEIPYSSGGTPHWKGAVGCGRCSLAVQEDAQTFEVALPALGFGLGSAAVGCFDTALVRAASALGSAPMQTKLEEDAVSRVDHARASGSCEPVAIYLYMPRITASTWCAAPAASQYISGHAF